MQKAELYNMPKWKEQENSRIFYCLVLVFCGCMAMKRRCGLGHIGWSPVIDRMMLDRVLTARLLQGWFFCVLLLEQPNFSFIVSSSWKILWTHKTVCISPRVLMCLVHSCHFYYVPLPIYSLFFKSMASRSNACLTLDARQHHFMAPQLYDTNSAYT